jgi:hypothetical protein
MPIVTASDLASVMTPSESLFHDQHAAHSLFSRPAVPDCTYAIKAEQEGNKWNIRGVEIRDDGAILVRLQYQRNRRALWGYRRTTITLDPTDQLVISRRRMD